MTRFRLPTIPRPKSALGKLLLGASLLAGLLAVAMLYVALVGMSIDGSLYRKPLQKILSAQLGRPVHLDGALDLHISLKPALRVRDFGIAEPEGFGEGDFVRVGELQVRLDLWPLIHRQFKAETLSASGVKIHLKQRADGSNNWTFPSLAETPEHLPTDEPDEVALPAYLGDATTDIIVINTIEGVSESVVIGVTDERWGEVGKAIIAWRPVANIPSNDIIKDYIANRLAKFKIPKYFMSLDELPKNDAGKLDRTKLKKLYS